MDPKRRAEILITSASMPRHSLELLFGGSGSQTSHGALRKHEAQPHSQITPVPVHYLRVEWEFSCTVSHWGSNR